MDEQNQNAVELQVGAANGNFATLEQARDYLRQTRPQRADDTPVRIVVHAGDYPLTHGFTLSQQDSGSAAAPTTYCAASAGTVRLLGGRKLDGFTAVEDREVLARLPTAAQANVVQIDLKRLAIEDFGHFSARGFSRPITPAHMELFFADKRMSVARWPASEWTHIDRPAAVGDDEHGGELGNLEEGFYFADKRPDNWRDLSEVWMHGYWGWDWANSYEAIAMRDAESGLIRTRPPHGLYGFRAGARFYFLNILEELAQPGQY